MGLEGQHNHPLIKSMDEVKGILARKQTLESKTKHGITNDQKPTTDKDDAIEELDDADLEEVR